MIAHPERAVRKEFAGNQRVAATQRSRLVNDPDVLVRATLAAGPHPRPARIEALPDDVLETLLTAHDDAGQSQLLTADEIKEELELSGQISPSFRRTMPDHKSPELRARAARLWLWLTPGQRNALLTDPNSAVRESARDNSRVLDPAAMAADLPEPDCHHRSLLLSEYAVAPAFIATPRQRRHLLTLPRLPRTVLQPFLHHEDPDLRALAAGDTTLDRPLIHLLTDPQARVRRAAAASPLLPPDLISTLLQDPETAEGAAANPSVSPERLHELLDLNGLARASAQ